MDHDYESGLDHAQFREYSSAGGRWLSPDPYSGSYDWSNPQSLNRYAYVMNNPLSLNDPSGQDGGLPGIGGLSGVGGCIGAAASEGTSVISDVGCGINVLKELIGLFSHPSFHGSLKPRPNAQPWDEYNIMYGPNIAGALGLPDGTCEFGACGGGMGFQQVSGGAVMSTLESYADDFGQLLLFPSFLRSTPFRFFGTHYCGPGGGGSVGPGLDSACYAHDLCYDKHGLHVADNFNPLLSPSKGAALQQCNQQLCDAASQSTSVGAEAVVNYFKYTGDYYCHQ